MKQQYKTNINTYNQTTITQIIIFQENEKI